MDTNKPGWQTTEFWAMLLTFVIPILEKLFKVDQGTLIAQIGNIAPVLAVIAYIFGRSKVKASAVSSEFVPPVVK
jgi:hypothetical protein